MIRIVLIITLIILSIAVAKADPSLDEKLKYITLPKGFSISVYADKVPNARSMTESESGILFVGTKDEGKVFALIDSNKDNRSDVTLTLASGLNQPNGVAYHKGSLYVAEISRVLRYDQVEEWARGGGKTPLKPTVIKSDLPKDGHHGWKYIRISPDGWMYIPVGAPCNICESKDPIYAAIHRMSLDGKKFETVAHGVRNTVGFDFHPVNGELWFTENGRDMMGDDVPTDELNKISKNGSHYGYPYCHQGTISDPQFGKERPCSEFVAPVRNLAPHVAALGMRFYTGKMFPAEFKNNVLIAEHGSWNRSTPLGYRVMRVQLKEGKDPTYESFATGWLQNGSAWGRPVDVHLKTDGSILVSDDKVGAIYRITYSAK